MHTEISHPSDRYTRAQELLRQSVEIRQRRRALKIEQKSLKKQALELLEIPVIRVS